MRKPLPLLATLVLLIGGLWASQHLSSSTASVDPVTSIGRGIAAGDTLPTATPAEAAWPAFLPGEARRTVALIQHGGPFPYRQDGTTFGNRERRLPQRERGWYREYTVDTPGLRHRGARRIITGGHPPKDWHYTDDHYESFRSFTPPAATEAQR
jgi:ribonuclease T1